MEKFMRHATVILLIYIGLATGAYCGQTPNPAIYVFDLQTLSHSYVSALQSQADPAKVEEEQRVRWYIYGGIGGAHTVGSVIAYNRLTKLWGASNGKFHFKDEFHDQLAFNDEVSHLLISYKLTQSFSSLYRRLGFSTKRGHILGALESALIMTAVEFPVDAFNPNQGFGMTDLVADYLGVGLAYWKSVDSRLSDFDIKLSIKSFSRQGERVLGYDNRDYDNYIYWLTYRYKFAVLGTGYGTTRSKLIEPEPQIFLGIGTTIPDLLRPVSSKLAEKLKPLELYYFNFRLNVI